MVDFTRAVRLFRVATYSKGTGPVDHDRKIVTTRKDFRAQLQHQLLKPGEDKASVGAWLPVDVKTRDEGATDGPRAGGVYPLDTQVGRHLENVLGSSASTFLDIDKVTDAQWAALLTTLRMYSGEAWSTASYDSGSGLVSARVHLHLDRELADADEVESVRRALNAVLGGLADRACLQPVSVFYLPAARGDSFVEHFNGAEIQVDLLPRMSPPRRATRDPRPLAPGAEVSDRDRLLAETELAEIAASIRLADSEHIRALTAVGRLFYLGQYVEAGALSETHVYAVIKGALEAWAERLYPGEDNADEVDRRLNQALGEAINDGRRLGPGLPNDRVLPRERVAADVMSVVPRMTPQAATDEAARYAGLGAPAVLALPTGVGKSLSTLKVIATSPMDAVIYTPSHSLAEEHHQTLLGLGVSDADIFHEMSPLHRPSGGEESCRRSRESRTANDVEGPSDLGTKQSPFAQAVRDNGLNLRASVCPRCPYAKECTARYPTASKARIKLRVHSAYKAVEDPGKAIVALDEEPEPFYRPVVTGAFLGQLATSRSPGPLALLTGAGHWNWTPRQVADRQRELDLESDLAETEPQQFDPGQAYAVRQAAKALHQGKPVPDEIKALLTKCAGEIRLGAQASDDLLAGRPLGATKEELDHIRAVIAMALSADPPSLAANGDRFIVVDSASWRDTIKGYARLLSATPIPGGYDLDGAVEYDGAIKSLNEQPRT